MNDPVVIADPLPYAASLQLRKVEEIDLVVIHCTELPDLATAREYGEKILHPVSGTGNSGHFYLERSGKTHLWVPVERVAHHVRDYNERSIGIELVNNGRYPHWFDSRHQQMDEPYGQPIIKSLTALLLDLKLKLPGLMWIAGHEELDTSSVPSSDNPQIFVSRKRDPGPLFPWQDLLQVLDLTPLEI